jgi:hypothetical protein
MRAAWVFIGLGSLGLFAAGCGGSGSGGTPDSGHPADSSKPPQDAAPESAADARHDAPAKDGGTPDAATDGGGDAASCANLDASISGLAIQPSCETCIGHNCCTQAQGCAAVTGCKAIEECATACVAGGTAAEQCAVKCIEQDAGPPPDGALSPSQNAAELLDLCLISHCSAECG